MIEQKNNDFCLPPLVGHRGASHRAPENTLPSFRLAWQEGAEGIEGDFWLTADGRIVCLHDPETARTAPGRPVLDVRSCRYADLRGYDVGEWKSPEFAGAVIPTIEEVLAQMIEGGMLYVEIKQDTPAIVTTLLELVGQSPVRLEQITLIAFSPEIVRQAKHLAPGMRVLLLYDLEDPATSLSTDALLALACSTGADGLGLGNSRKIDAQLVQKMRGLQLEFHVWTVNRVEDAMRLLQLGVDSITTDRPQGLRREMLAQLRQGKVKNLG